MPLESHARPQSDDQSALAICEGDLHLGSGIEIEPIRFDAVTEDDPVLRHQGADLQPLGFHQPPVDQADLGGPARKGLANGEP